MVMQAEFVAHWADERRLAFIGDGDSISVCIAYMKARKILEYGPSTIKVFDFDERIVGAVNRFADKERLETLSAELCNCLDPFPDVNKFDCFYTNPPWGASNGGNSVHVFAQRGIEAVGYEGDGAIVIADDDTLGWPEEVLASTQKFASESGFFVSRMMPRLHAYHLDDEPNLKSCNLMVKSLPQNARRCISRRIEDEERLQHFYGLDQQPKVRYVREVKRLDYGKASDGEYRLEILGEASA